MTSDPLGNLWGEYQRQLESQKVVPGEGYIKWMKRNPGATYKQFNKAYPGNLTPEGYKELQNPLPPEDNLGWRNPNNWNWNNQPPPVPPGWGQPMNRGPNMFGPPGQPGGKINKVPAQPFKLPPGHPLRQPPPGWPGDTPPPAEDRQGQPPAPHVPMGAGGPPALMQSMTAGPPQSIQTPGPIMAQRARGGGIGEPGGLWSFDPALTRDPDNPKKMLLPKPDQHTTNTQLRRMSKSLNTFLEGTRAGQLGTVEKPTARGRHLGNFINRNYGNLSKEEKARVFQEIVAGHTTYRKNNPYQVTEADINAQVGTTVYVNGFPRILNSSDAVRRHYRLPPANNQQPRQPPPRGGSGAQTGYGPNRGGVGANTGQFKL